MIKDLNGRNFCIRPPMKKFFYMKNHLLEKLYPNSTGGTPLKIFRILKNLTEKSYDAFKIWRQKNSKKMQKINKLAMAH